MTQSASGGLDRDIWIDIWIEHPLPPQWTTFEKHDQTSHTYYYTCM